MGAALTIFAVVSISILVVRIGAVAFQHTGLTESTARFQALSVFTGCGFTTSESETIVNYPVRRQIAAVLMVIGNLGLVGVLSTLIVSFVGTDGSSGAILNQISWFAGGLIALWLVMYNKKVDIFMCGVIGSVLRKTTALGKRDYHKLLQVTNGHSICDHFLTESHIRETKSEDWLAESGFKLLAVERLAGPVELIDIIPDDLQPGDNLLLLGPEEKHDMFGLRVS